MTYLQFHAVFLLPPLLALALSARRDLRRLGSRSAAALPLLCLLAVGYTAAWDGYLIARGVWSYGADRVVGTLAGVPLEEYLFFVLQPLLTGLWLFRWLDPAIPPPPAPRLRWAGAAALAAVAGAGVLLLGSPGGTYLGLILVWAAPVLALQVAWGGGVLLAQRRALLIGAGVPTLYLWAADAMAIRLGIWTISADHTLGIAAAGLPLEEAVFFLVTNLMVAGGLTLFAVGGRAPALEPVRAGG